MNLGHFVEQASQSLPENIYHNPRQTIRHLLQSLCGISQMEIHLRPEQIIEAQVLQNLQRAVLELKEGQPLAYVLGELTFLEWDFHCDARAFIPRPETEALVAMVREKAKSKQGPLSVLDMCCGTGAMGLSLALSFPESSVLLTELSKDALALTTKNLMRYELQNRVVCLQSDLWQSVPHTSSFDIIVCNPPYVATHEHVDEQVLTFEPHMALFSDDQGLRHVKEMLSCLDHFLKPSGIAAFELGHTHSETLNPWLLEQGFQGTFNWEADPFGVRRFLFYKK